MFSRSLIFLALAGCASGLTAINETDIGESLDDSDLGDTDPDTDLGEPLDTGPEEPLNTAPKANAGTDQSVQAATVVALDGSASSDPEGDPLNYSWDWVSKPQGSTATLINDTRVDPEFWADVNGVFVIQLEVDDGEFTSTDDVTITVDSPNQPPVASAGPDQTVTTGTLVSLDGSASYDPDSDPLSYSWSLVSLPVGSNASLLGGLSATPGFTADVDGIYTVELVVNDGTVDSPPDTVRITAQSSSGGGGGCDCSFAETMLKQQLSAGEAASGLGLLGLPLILGIVARRRA